MIDRKMTSWGSEIGTCSIFNVPPNISKDSRFLDSCHVLLSLVVSFADSALFQLETWQDVQKLFFFSEHPKVLRITVENVRLFEYSRLFSVVDAKMSENSGDESTSKWLSKIRNFKSEKLIEIFGHLCSFSYITAFLHILTFSYASRILKNLESKIESWIIFRHFSRSQFLGRVRRI